MQGIQMPVIEHVIYSVNNAVCVSIRGLSPSAFIVARFSRRPTMLSSAAQSSSRPSEGLLGRKRGF